MASSIRSVVGVGPRQQDAGARVLGHLAQVRLEGLDGALAHVLEGVRLAERAEGVLDGHVDVVVRAARVDRRLCDRRDLRVLSRRRRGRAGGGSRRSRYRASSRPPSARGAAPPRSRRSRTGSRPAPPSPREAPAGALSPSPRHRGPARATTPLARSCSGRRRRRWPLRRRPGRSPGPGSRRSRRAAGRTRGPAAPGASRSCARAGRGRRPVRSRSAWPRSLPAPAGESWTRRASAIFRAISSCTSKTSAISRS